MQNKLGLKNTKLEQLSDTRWVCRFKSCNALIQNYKSILMTLDDEILEQKSKDVAQVIGTLFKLFNYELYSFFFNVLYLFDYRSPCNNK